MNNLDPKSERITIDSTEALRNPTAPPIVTGLFRDRDSAENAYNAITHRGYDRRDVNVVMSDATRTKHFSADNAAETELGNKAAEGAGVGGVIGGTIGAIAAAVAAVGTAVVVPGLGFVIAGPIVAALAGAGAGGLIGALIGWGIPADRVKLYQTGIDDGGILIAVKPRSTIDAQHFEREWTSGKGEYVYR